MKTKFNSHRKIQLKKFHRRLKSKEKRRKKRFKNNVEHVVLNKILGKDFHYYDLLMAFLPKNLKYLITCEQSPLKLFSLLKVSYKHNGRFFIPEVFSLVDAASANKSYTFIKELTAALVLQKNDDVVLDYSACLKIGLEAQVYLDVIIKDLLTFYKRCAKFKKTKQNVVRIRGENISSDEVRKLLFSVGSPVIHSKNSIDYPDIVPYKLCVHNSLSNNPKTIEKKELHTTDLVDYVIKCLSRVNRSLSPEKLEDLCIVISEILINAEEHSSTKFRFSIGYFSETNHNGSHQGIFRLVILNFGQTIYEKFKDPNCPNQHSINKMTELSQSYNRKKFFIPQEFEEETLWTLYSLQEGITSTDPDHYKKRGNGSIRFIESFFNIKGKQNVQDDFSQMTLVSGQTQVSFEGTYNIVENYKNEDLYQYMTFNKSGNIMNKPDDKFVKFVPNYFPGTFISAEILFNEDDLEHETK